jgi:hypothetical protein
MKVSCLDFSFFRSSRRHKPFKRKGKHIIQASYATNLNANFITFSYVAIVVTRTYCIFIANNFLAHVLLFCLFLNKHCFLFCLLWLTDVNISIHKRQYLEILSIIVECENQPCIVRISSYKNYFWCVVVSQMYGTCLACTMAWAQSLLLQ